MKNKYFRVNLLYVKEKKLNRMANEQDHSPLNIARVILNSAMKYNETKFVFNDRGRVAFLSFYANYINERSKHKIEYSTTDL